MSTPPARDESVPSGPPSIASAPFPYRRSSIATSASSTGGSATAQRSSHISPAAPRPYGRQRSMTIASPFSHPLAGTPEREARHTSHRLLARRNSFEFEPDEAAEIGLDIHRPPSSLLSEDEIEEPLTDDEDDIDSLVSFEDREEESMPDEVYRDDPRDVSPLAMPSTDDPLTRRLSPVSAQPRTSERHTRRLQRRPSQRRSDLTRLSDHQRFMLYTSQCFHYLFPVVLVIAGWARFNVISFLYLVLAYMLGLSHMTRYHALRQPILLSALTLSALCTVLQITMQLIYLFVAHVPGQNPILVLLGCQQVNPRDLTASVQQCLPDPLLLLTAIATLVLHRQTQHLTFLRGIHPSISHSPLVGVLQKAGQATKCLAPVLLNMSLCIAAVSYPGLLSMPYLITVLGQTILWQHEKRRYLARLTFISFCSIYLYATVHLAFVVLIQNKVLFGYLFRGDAHHPWLTRLGLPVLTLNNTKSASSLAFAALLFYVVIPMFVGPLFLDRRQPNAHLTPRHPLSALVSIFWQIARTEMQDLPWFIQAIHAACSLYRTKLAAAASLTFAITYPSYFTLPLLVWSLIFLILPHSLYRYASLYVPFYIAMLISLHYCFNFDGLQMDKEQDTGLFHYALPGKSLGIQLGLHCFTAFVHHVRQGDLDPLPLYRFFHAGKEEEETLPTQSVIALDGITRAVNAVNYHYGRAKQFLVAGIKHLGLFIVSYAYLISLGIVYLCALTQVNLLQVPFLLFFIVYLILPRLARSGWLFLILYTEVVIFLQFMWQFSWAASSSKTFALWGLCTFRDRDLWQGMSYHLVILLFTLVQEEVYTTLRKNRLALQRAAQESTSYTDLPIADSLLPHAMSYDQLHSRIRKEEEQHIPTMLVDMPSPTSSDALLPPQEDLPIPQEEAPPSVPRYRWTKTDHEFFRSVKAFFMLARMLIQKNVLNCCYLFLSVKAFLGHTNFIDLGYIFFVCVCMTLQHFKRPDVIRQIWPVVVFFTGAFAAFAYIYQFEALARFLQQQLGMDWIHDIGLKQKVGFQLHRYLLPHVAILLVCCYQYRLFHHSSHASSGTSLPTPDWRSFFVSTSQSKAPLAFLDRFGTRAVCLTLGRFWMIHTPKVMIVLLFFITIKRPAILGALGLLYILAVSPTKLGKHLNAGIFLIIFEIYLLSQLIFQLNLVQSSLPHVGYAQLVGFVKLNAEKPCADLVLEIVFTFLLGFMHVFDRIALHETEKEPDLPHERRLWPIIPRRLYHSPSVARINYWASHFYSLFGVQICTFMHGMIAMTRVDLFSLFYLASLAARHIVPTAYRDRLFPFYLTLLSLSLFGQYIVLIGQTARPLIGWIDALPIYHWAPEEQAVFGVPMTATTVLFIPDFFLYLSAAFQMFAIKHARAQDPMLEAMDTFGEPTTVHIHVTQRRSSVPSGPRRGSILYTETEKFIARHFSWLCFILIFAAGTARVNLLAMPFLMFALYYIQKGEKLVVKRSLRSSRWSVILTYAYLWMAATIIFQVPAYLLHLTNDRPTVEVPLRMTSEEHIEGVDAPVPEEDGHSSGGAISGFTWQSFFGLYRLKSGTLASPVSGDTLLSGDPSLGGTNLLILLLFGVLLIQYRLARSPIMLEVAKIIRRDHAHAHSRAVAYRRKVTSDIQETKEAYQQQIDDLREQVMQAVMHREDIKDWITLFNQNTIREGDVTFSTAARRPPPVADAVEETVELAENAVDRAAASATTDTLSAPPVRRESGPARVEVAVQQAAQTPSRAKQWLYHLIVHVYGLSHQYRHLHPREHFVDVPSTIASQPWRALFHASWLAVCAHTVNVAYLTILINQIVHANVLSTIPSVTILLFAMCQRPYPSERIWSFTILFTEMAVLLKFIFQIAIFRFNAIPCGANDVGKPFSTWWYILGIDRQDCMTLFVRLIPELCILIACILHRTLMRKLGLWYDATSWEDGLLQEATAEPTSSPLSEAPMGAVQTFITPHHQHRVRAQSTAHQLEGTPTARPPYLMDGSTSSDPLVRWLYRFKHLFVGITRSRGLLGKDLYLPLFVADLIVFLITIFSWSSFSGEQLNDNDIQFLNTVFAQNTVPPLFIGLAMTNFVLLVMDRMIYTSKNLVAKYLLQYATVIGFHVWLFFILPYKNDKRFAGKPILPLWYICKCFYWYFSGQQIKSGYPPIRINHFLMRSYSYWNRIAFIAYRSIPFVFELRAIVDWTITPTTMTMYRWMKFEDIYANLYSVKCTREYERLDDRPFGHPLRKNWQRAIGGLVIFGITILVWFPLLLLAIPGSTKPNPSTEVYVALRLNGFIPIWEQDLRSNDLPTLTPSEFASLRDLTGSTLFPSYTHAENVQRLQFPTSAMSTWTINPPSRQALLGVLNDTDATAELTFTWTLTRADPPLGTTLTGASQPVVLNSAEKKAMLTMLTEHHQSSLALHGLYPHYLHALQKNGALNLASNTSNYLANVELKYFRDGVDGQNEWFELCQQPTVPVSERMQTPPAIPSCQPPTMILLSDQVPVISTLSSYGVIGLYVVVVLAAGRFLRTALSNLIIRIMYEDLPNPDDLLAMCQNILLCRQFAAQGATLETEEILYHQLITIFRSPQELLKRTMLQKKQQ